VFAIATEQQQYKTYILCDQTSKSRLTVVPERGGIITSWQVQSQDILYLDAERFANPNLSVRGGIPILFPICGNLPDNTYTYQGQQYILKQHGFARDLPWEVVDQSTENLASLTLVLNSNEQTLAVYPFEFQLAFTYELIGNKLHIRQRYTNHSASAMPFSTGLHPYFLSPNKSQLQFQIPASEYLDQRTKITHAFAGDFDLSLDEIDVAFGRLSAQSAAVTDPTRSLEMTLSYDDSYPIVVFWTVKGKEFYCLEPWSAGRNALNTAERLIYLQSGSTLETLVSLSVNFLEK
jgi:galactose mutarotase-like enzyme